MSRSARQTASAPRDGMYGWLEAAVSRGADIVTVNNRLARALRQAYDRRQLERGRLAWRTPRILPWLTWAGQLSADSAGAPLRLDPQASLLLWERLLLAEAGDRVSGAASLARQMQQTWQRLQDWQIPLEQVRSAASGEDQQLFSKIAGAYLDELDRAGWLDAARTTAAATAAATHPATRLPPELVHVGFDRITPAAAAMFAALERRGCRVVPAPAPDRQPAPRLICAPNAEAELRAAGAWARRRLEAEPDAKLGVVLPGLEQAAMPAARLLREGLVPGWQWGGERHRHAVDVSYGRRLSEYPMVATALLWLRWTGRPLFSRDVSVLLRSPFSGDRVGEGRAQLEAALRELPDRGWTAAAVTDALRRDNLPEDALDWLHRLAVIREAERSSDAIDTPAAWAGRIDGTLQQLGWPGTRALDSEEFQLQNRWRELLNAMTRLEPVRPRMRFEEACSRLAAMASETIFQPESDAAVLPLLGPLEAAGLEFDGLWFAGLESMQWPPPSHPLTLVSRSLQRSARMPDATPSDTLQFADTVLRRIIRSADSVILSWPATDRDSELAPSPMLPKTAPGAVGQAKDPGWFAASVAGSDHLMTVPDPAPGIRPGEQIAGGAYTVQRQLVEPFAAFAYGRLGVRELQSFTPGLPPRLRGNIVHAALQALLEELPDQTALRGWSAADRKLRIDSAVAAALRKHAPHADELLRRLLDFESRRLALLLEAFLDEELARPPFAVAEVEAALPLERHGARLSLRLDRLDKLADGSWFVADYKTGAPKKLLGGDGDPVEWQLVVYACSIEGPVGGLAIINLDSRGIRYVTVGTSAAGGSLEDDEWHEELTRWRAIVDTAIGKLAEGDTRINLSLAASDHRPLGLLKRVEELKRGR